MTNEIIKKAVQEFTNQALKKIPNDITEIYLFGSCARGDYDNESDIDVFVVINPSKNSLRKSKDKLLDIASDIGLENDVFLSLTISDKKEWEKNKDFSLLYKNILSEGVQYYG